MSNSLLKFMCIGFLAIMPVISSCTHDKDEATTADVLKVLEKTNFTLNGSDIIGPDYVNFNYTIEPAQRSILSANDVMITRVEFFFDDEHISTSYNEPYRVDGSKTGLSSGITHKLYAHVYGRSNSDNETYLYFLIKEYKVAGSADCYLDYNYVGEGDTFTISAKLNPEKSAQGVHITSFKANWGPYSMGTCTSEPFVLSHAVTDKAGTERDITAVIKLSNGETIYPKFYVTVLSSTAARIKNDILSSTTVFKQSDILRCKAQNYVGKDYDGGHSLIVYFDDEQIASTKKFPYTYEKSMRNVAKGIHKLRCRMANLDSNGDEKNFAITEEIITVE